MNLPQFLNQVDAATSEMSQEELSSLIHSFARITPEKQRADFLTKLCALNLNADSTTHSGSEQQSLLAMRKEKDALKQKLSSIRDGELCMTGEYNEGYDDWNDDGGDEFLFEDPKGVLKIIEGGCMLVHQCADAELYEDGYEIAELLLTVEVNVNGDYADYDGGPLCISDLEQLELLQYSMGRFVLDAMYLAYQALLAEERVGALYGIFCNPVCENITLQNMMQDAKTELEYQDEFLDDWIYFLGKCKSRKAEILIGEAVLLKNDFNKTLDYARSFYTYHPGIYELLLSQLKEEKDKDELLISVGQEAIQKLEEQYLVRSSIALLTSEACLRMGKQHEAEVCQLEAFRSQTNLTNYLRLFCEDPENTKCAEVAKQIYVTKYETQKDENYSRIQFGEPQESRMSNHDYYAIAFFDKEFRQVIEGGMNVKESLGWSSTFMKTGIALFMLLLYSEKELPSGCRKMCENIVFDTGFSSEDYEKGLNCTFNMGRETLFWNIVKRWKAYIVLPEEEQLAMISKLGAWIDMRVEGIMQNNRRNYYDECAAFVAAFGEVLESRGKSDGKNQMLKSYKAKYSRRRAFHDELKCFGMRN